jgi:hypothetical protein
MLDNANVIRVTGLKRAAVAAPERVASPAKALHF